jgi:hypothetical protein
MGKTVKTILLVPTALPFLPVLPIPPCAGSPRLDQKIRKTPTHFFE